MSFLTKALSPTVREIRIFLSQTGQPSAGTRYDFLKQRIVVLLRTHRHTRQFLLKSYPILKQHNPDLPVLIREVQGTPARAFARFGA